MKIEANKRLLVTGAQGFVAGSVLAQASKDWEVHALSRNAAPAGSNSWDWHVCDPLVPGELEKAFREIQPHAVIHTAALADIDYCETHPELAEAVNVGLTRNLANLCGATGARLVHCSTDTVFDGEHAPYNEDAIPSPVNLYGNTKVAAEEIVAKLGTRGIIARLALVVGLPFLGEGNSFLARMIKTLKEGNAVSATEREIRTPVDVVTVGKALLELADGSYGGVVNLAGLSRVNRLQLAQAIADRFGFSRELVLAQATASAPGRAPRPRDVSLDNQKTRSMLQTQMCTLDEGLSLILESAENRLA